VGWEPAEAPWGEQWRKEILLESLRPSLFFFFKFLTQEAEQEDVVSSQKQGVESIDPGQAWPWELFPGGSSEEAGAFEKWASSLLLPLFPSSSPLSFLPLESMVDYWCYELHITFFVFYFSFKLILVKQLQKT
jgi:hypothetical protein